MITAKIARMIKGLYVPKTKVADVWKQLAEERQVIVDSINNSKDPTFRHALSLVNDAYCNAMDYINKLLK